MEETVYRGTITPIWEGLLGQRAVIHRPKAFIWGDAILDGLDTSNLENTSRLDVKAIGGFSARRSSVVEDNGSEAMTG